MLRFTRSAPLRSRSPTFRLCCISCSRFTRSAPLRSRSPTFRLCCISCSRFTRSAPLRSRSPTFRLCCISCSRFTRSAPLRSRIPTSFAAFALRACCSAVTFVAYMVSCKQACQIPCPLLTVNRSICHLQRIRPEALYPLRIPEKLHHLLRCDSSYLQSLTDLLLLRNHHHR